MQSTAHQIRSSLPPLPERIKALPVSENGYPIPFFVKYIEGKPDFRVVDPAKLASCVKGNLCWICGHMLGRHKAFSAGPHAFHFKDLGRAPVSPRLRGIRGPGLSVHAPAEVKAPGS